MNCDFLKRFYLVLIIIIVSLATKATELDSLLALLPQAKDTQSSLINLNIGKIYLKQRNFNSALQYFNNCEEISNKIILSGKMSAPSFPFKEYEIKDSALTIFSHLF